MAAYTVYATTAQLAEYLGTLESSLPDGSERMLTRASELIFQMCHGNIDESNADHMDAAQLATCAQVEYWVEMGESMSSATGFTSLKIGSFSANFDKSASGGSMQVSQRSQNYLNREGLLYRGVKSHASSIDFADSDLHN